MSLSFLSRQDVESWVPEPSPSGGGAGFVAKLFTTINRAMASLTSVLSINNDEAHQRCRNEFERFFLWGQGLSIVDGDLDEVLAHSKELHFRVLSLLLRLGTVTLQGLSRDPVPSFQGLIEQYDDLRTLLDTAETMLHEPEPDESARLYTQSESDDSEYEATEILDEISIYIECLLDLSPSLDNPALDIQIEDSDELLTQAKESFTVSSEEALIYCRKIRDRFEVLPKYLVERLAEANVRRAAALREMRSRPIKDEAPISDDIAESLFSTTDPRFTETTRSTVPSSSVFSSVMESSSFSGHVPVLEFDDNASEATFASFSTAVSAIGLGRPRVPTMPEIQGDGFNCPICFSHVTNVKTQKEWKKHVFDDLKPYVCTIEDCKDTTMLYNHSGMWAQHEASHPSSASRSSECSFCSAIYQHGGPAHYKHVSAHLREVSLSVLPQPSDDDNGFDTDDSDPPISTPGSEPIHPDTDFDKEAEPKEYLPIGEAEVEGYQSQPPLLPIPSVTTSDPYPTPGRQYRLYSPPETEATGAEPGPITDASATSEKDAPGTEKTESTFESTSAFASASQAAAGSASNPDEVDLDSIIDRLLDVRGSRPGKQVQLLEAEIRYLCTKAREIFYSQSTLLELAAPITVIGDIHGQYYDLLRSFEMGGFPPEKNYMFLGNYVDYGKQSLEVMCLILAYKIKYSENFFLLRGNHESASINRIYGFYDECKRRYNIRLWKAFNDLFNCMPVAAVIDEKIFCMHGGLSPDLNSLEQIRRIMRPTDVPDCGLLCDLLWSDPDKDITGWGENDRGENDQVNSFTFGPDVVSRFLQKHDMDLIVRGNQVVEDGYEFFANRQLVTIWGAPNFGGEFDNAAGMMHIDESLLCSFLLLKPAERKQKFGQK